MIVYWLPMLIPPLGRAPGFLRFLVLHGAYALLILLILAEVTSFCQNTWTLACVRKGDSEFAAKVFNYLSPPFYILYSIVRGLAGPLFMYKMIVFYTSRAANDVISRWVWASWICIITGAVVLLRFLQLLRVLLCSLGCDLHGNRAVTYMEFFLK